jgi:SPP1 gp7 family putative phage head morphogenesis protein
MAKHILWDGQKSVDLDQYPPQAWNNLGGQTSDTGNDSREDRAAAGKFYETVAVLYRCVTLRQVGISRVPWVITRNGKDIWLDEDPMPPAQLAYLTDFRRLLRLTEAALCLSPEAFWFVERNRVKPLSLRWHSPSSIIPQWREADGLVGFKRILSQGHFKMFEPADYVYFALPNPLHETIPGRPAAQAALAAAGLLYAIDAFGSAFISRGAIKATLLTAPVGTSPTERDRLRAWWRRAFGGIGNAFGTEVISSEVKPVIVGEGLEQLNNGELTRAKQEEIATSLGVPHSLVFSNAANFATASQDDMHFYDKTVIPSFSFLAEVLNEQLLGPQGFALELRPESMSIYQEDEKERAASVGALVQAGMSLVLALEILGYDLTDEQWAQMKEIPEPVAPSAPVVPVVPVVPVPTPGADIIIEPNNVLEKATFRRWAAKRKNPNPDAFRSDILTTADKAAVLAEMMEDADGGTLPPFLPRGGAHTHKATNPATPDPEAELRKRESAERKAEQEIAAGLKKQQAAVEAAMRSSGTAAAAEQAVTESRTTATEALRRALLSGSDLGVAYAIAGLESVGFGMDWTLVNEDAKKWAERAAGQLIKDIDATTIDSVRRHVAAWAESGAPLESLIEKLTPTFGQGRASLIAATETTRAYAEGNRIAYKASGVVTSWEWQTANDNLVCPICGPLNGKVVKIDAPFNVHLPAGMKVEAFDAPPSHPGCRCWLTPTIDELPAQQTAQAGDGGRGADAAREREYQSGLDRLFEPDSAAGDLTPTYTYTPFSETEFAGEKPVTTRTEAEAQGWQSVMSSAQADIWAKNSVVQNPMLHMTSESAATSIRQNGFSLDRTAWGRVYGDGVYMSDKTDVVSIYRMEGGGETLKLKINVTNPYHFETDEVPYSGMRKLASELGSSPAELDRLSKILGTVDADERVTRNYAAAITNIAQDAGYDSLHIVPQSDRLLHSIGGDQWVIFDTKKVTVIWDE